MNIKRSNDSFFRSIKSSAECIEVDLETQSWTLAGLNEVSPGTYQMRLTYHGNLGAKDAFGELFLEADLDLLSITLPWRTDTSAYESGPIGPGLQMEGSATNHDQFLSSLVSAMVAEAADYDDPLPIVLSDPEIFVWGFRSGPLFYRQLGEIVSTPVRIPDHKREFLLHFLSSIAEGLGKMGAVSHMQWDLGLSYTHATRLAREFLNEYEPLFHQVRWGTRYDLTDRGKTVLKRLRQGEI